MSDYEIFRSNTEVSAQDAKEVIQIAQGLTRQEFLERAIPLMASPDGLVVDTEDVDCYCDGDPGCVKSLVDGITNAFVEAGDVECCESFYMGVHCFILKRASGVELYASKSKFETICEMENECAQRRKAKEELIESWRMMAFWAVSFSVSPAKAIRHFCDEYQDQILRWRIPLQLIAMAPSKMQSSNFYDRLIELCHEWDIDNLAAGHS